MVRIVLNDTFILSSDAHQWILMKRFGKFWKNYSFYNSLASLLEDYLSLSLRASDCKSIQELLDFQKMLVRQLNKAITPLQIKICYNQNG